MKVLMVNHFPLDGSGSGAYTLNVAKELVHAGHEVLVLVPEHVAIRGYPFPIWALFSVMARMQVLTLPSISHALRLILTAKSHFSSSATSKSRLM